MKLTKRLLAMLLLVCMVLSMLPAIALTASATTTTIASWGKVSLAKNTAVKASDGDSSNKNVATLTSPIAITSSGTNCYYASSWTNGNAITMANLTTSNYSNISVSFYSRGSQQGNITVSASSNGSSYTNVGTVKVTKSEAPYTVSSIPAGTTSIKFTYAATGSLYFGTVSVAGEAAPTKTLSSIAVSSNHRSFTVGGTFVKETVTATYSDSSTADVTNSATFSGYNMSSAGTQTVTASYTEGGVTKTATYQITVTAPTPYTLTYSVNGDTSVISGGTITSGSSVSLPANVTAPADYTFSGWVASAIGTETTTAPTVLTGSYTMPAANTTLYALFTRTEQVQGGSSDKYELVTSASSLAAGDKILIVGVESGSYYALKPYVSGNNCGRNAVSAPVSNVITTTVADLTLGGSAGAWTLFDGTYYLYAAGGTGSSNYLKGAANDNNANAKWTISFSGNNATIKTTDSTVARHTIMHNTGSDIFSCYASGQAAVSIYKQKAGTTTTTYYTTTVQTPAVSYTLTYSASPAAGGSITCASTSGASIAEDTSVSLTAAANTHYTFTGWTVNGASAGSNATLNITMDADKTVVANFTADPTYTVTITPAAGGTMTASKLTGIYAGETVTLTAEPNTHYTFTGWQCTAGGASISGNSFTMPAANVTITGSFTEAAQYTVTYSVIGDTEAIASVTDYVGTQITLPASVTVEGLDGDYSFAGWVTASTNGEDVTTATVLTGNYNIPASNTTLYAVFTRTETGGSAASLTKMAAGNTLADGDKIVVVAPDAGVAMYQETVNTSYVNKYTFDGNVNTVLADDKNYFTVNAVTGGFTLGDATNGYLNMSSNNLYVNATTSTWTLADLNDGTFKLQSNGRNLSYRSDLDPNKYWRMGGTSYGTSGETVLELYKVTEGSSSTTYYNTDPEVIHKYTLTVDSNIANGSVTATAGEYEEGDTVNLSYAPNTGYQFDGYVLTKDADSSDVTATYISGSTLTMPAFDVTLSASFSLIPATYYSVTPSYNAEGGSISVSPTSAEEGDEITVTISPNTHWTLTSLTVNGAAVDLTGITNTYTFELVPPAEGKDVPVVAVFTEDAKYTVTIDPAVVTGGTLSADKTADIYAGETVTLTATPNAHYTFDGWQCTAGGATISGNSFTMPASNVTLSGSFTAEAHITVTFHAYSAESQPVTTAISDKYYNGDTVLAADVPAVEAPNGYVFMGWYGSTYAENASAPAYVTPAGTAIGSTALDFYAVYGKSSAGSSPYFKLSLEYTPKDGTPTTYYVGGRTGTNKYLDCPTDAANAAQFGIDAGGYLYFMDGSTKTYISSVADGADISFATNISSATPWTVTENNGTVVFQTTHSVSGKTNRYFSYNVQNPRFAAYNGAETSYPRAFTKIGGPSYDSYTTDPARIAPELTAVDDTVIFDRDRALTFNVLTNDDLDYLDATGVTVTVTDTLPAGVVNNNDGTFTFTPSGMQSADITFSYTITDKADSTATATATVTLKPAAVVYYDESDSGVFTFTPEPGSDPSTGWAEVTDPKFASLPDGTTEYDAFVMYSGGKAMETEVDADHKDTRTVSFSFAGTGFDLIAATTGSSGTALITVKQDGVTKKTALVDTYRGYTYAVEKQTVYMLQRVDRYKAVTEDDKTTYEKYDPMLDGAVITDYTYIVDKENGGYKENTTWYSGEPGTVHANNDFTVDSTGASSCIVVEQETNWIPTADGTDDGNFYQIPVLKMLGLPYGTYDVTVKVVYNALFDHDSNGSYEFIFDGVNIHDPVNGRVDYNYIDLRQSIIDSDSSFGSVEIAPCDHETKTDWTFYSAASGNATGEALNRGSFVKRCTVCNDITDRAYFHVTTSANPTTIGLTGTSTLSYTLTSDIADVQTILNGLTFSATWTTNDSTVIRCSNGVATAQNKEGSTYAKLGLKVGEVQYASVIKSPTITVANSQPEGYTATFHVPAGATAPAALTGNSVTMPAAVAAPASCDAHTYTFAGWVKSAVAYDDTAPAASDILAAGAPVTLDANTDFYALYSYEIGGGTSNVYQIVTSAPTDWSGKYIIVNPNKDHAMSNTLKSGSNEINASAITVTDNKVDNPSADLIWELTKNPNNASQYSLYNAAGDVYAGITGTSSTNASLNSTENFFTIEVNGTDNVYDITSVTNSARCFSYYGTNETFRTYAKSNNNTGYLFKQQIAAPETYYTTNPGHMVSDTGTATAATCTEDGYTGDVICSECGMKLEDGDAIPAPGHNYEITSNPGVLDITYTCSVCHDSYIEYYEYAVSYVLQPGVTVSGGSRNVNAITLPNAASIPATYDAQTYTLVGWADATSADSTTNPTVYAKGEVVNIIADTTFYPVYSYGSGSGGSNYEKVTSTTDLANGQYLIVYEDGSVAFNSALTTLDAVSNTISVTISDGKIASNTTTDAAAFTFTASNGSFLGTGGKYFGNASNTNGLTSDTNAMSNTVSIDSGNAVIVSSGGAYLRYNAASDQTRFRYYKSGTYTAQQAIQLYKLVAGTPAVTTYTFELQQKAPHYSAAITPTRLSLTFGATATLTATLLNNGEAATAKSISYRSDNNVVTVNASTGALTAGNTAGTAVVTATVTATDDTTYTATCTVYVSEEIDNITVNYIGSSTGKVYNWGTRGTVATFLTAPTTGYYTGSYSYDTLFAMSGNSGTGTDFYGSQLGSAIHLMLVAKQTTQTSYDGTRSLYAYTDCIESDTAHVSGYYTGKTLSSTWDSGSTWNREHVWPSSKCINTNHGADGADIMMLRPESASDNSGRGNTAFGESSGYYNPDAKYPSKAANVRGDVARNVLYTLMRWGNTTKFYGTGGVIESRAILLKWMNEDPVDTWELARNDAAQRITGVRNIFVDYPELAYKLLGATMPNNYSTPSSRGIVAKATYSATRPSNYEPVTAGSGGTPNSTTRSASAHRVAPTVGTITGAVVIDGKGNTTSLAAYEENGPKYGVYLAPGQALVFRLSGDQKPSELQIGAKALNGRAAKLDVLNVGQLVTPMLEKSIASATEQYYDLDVSKLGWNDTSSDVIVLYNDGEGILDVTQLRYPTTDGTLTLNVSEMAAQNAAKMLRIVYGIPETAPDPIEPTDLGLNFKSAALVLNSDISMNFYVEEAVLNSAENVYAVFTKALYNKAGEITGYDEKTVTEITQSECGYAFRFDGINPAEMGSAVTATLYGYRDGELISGETVDYSVLTYVNNMFANSKDASFKTLLADLVNYGAAAQTYVSYNTASPVTAGVSADLLTCATTAAPALKDRTSFVKNDAASVVFTAASLSLRDKVTVRYELDASGYEGNVADLELRISYRDYDGTDKTAVVSGADFTEANGRYVASFSELNAVQMRTVLHASVYADDICVSDTLFYSIESYASAMAGGDDALADLVLAMMRYGDSAAECFRK